MAVVAQGEAMEVCWEASGCVRDKVDHYGDTGGCFGGRSSCTRDRSECVGA